MKSYNSYLHKKRLIFAKNTSKYFPTSRH